MAFRTSERFYAKKKSDKGSDIEITVSSGEMNVLAFNKGFSF